MDSALELLLVCLDEPLLQAAYLFLSCARLIELRKIDHRIFVEVLAWEMHDVLRAMQHLVHQFPIFGLVATPSCITIVTALFALQQPLWIQALNQATDDI